MICFVTASAICQAGNSSTKSNKLRVGVMHMPSGEWIDPVIDDDNKILITMRFDIDHVRLVVVKDMNCKKAKGGGEPHDLVFYARMNPDKNIHTLSTLYFSPCMDGQDNTKARFKITVLTKENKSYYNYSTFRLYSPSNIRH